MVTIALTALLLGMAMSAFAQTSPTASPNAIVVPGLKNIVQTANDLGNLKTFTSLVDKAGMTDTLNTGGPYTILAPSDDAFKSIPPDTLNALSNNTPVLKSVLNNHIIQGRYTANQLLDAKKVTTIDNKTLLITPRQGSIKIGNGFIVKEDIPATNGIIQVMDTVIIPS